MSKLKMPPGCVLVRDPGMVTTLIGAEVFRKQVRDLPAADRDVRDTVKRAGASGARTDASERTAYHESGHAICGRVLGFACGGASITAHGTGSATVAGVLSLHWDLTRGDILSSVLDKITVCWSGPVAEDIKFGTEHDADDVRGDLAQIKQLAARYAELDRTRRRDSERPTTQIPVSAGPGDRVGPNSKNKLHEWPASKCRHVME